MAAMKCEVCGKGPPHHALYRVNAKGVPGVWRCEQCLRPQDAPDEDVYAIVKAIEGKA